MEKGKLYRVNSYALSDTAKHKYANWSIVDGDGYLWIWEGERDVPDLDAGYMCRSLATGEMRCFYPDELEAADD
jgi:hypothetical protein